MEEPSYFSLVGHLFKLVEHFCSISSPAILGYIADHTKSRRFPLLFGLALLAGATAMLCMGTSVRTFLIGRTLQGMSAAMVWTAGLALLADNIDKGELGLCLGYVTMAINAGTLLGPLSGGIVYDMAGYFAVYEMAFALIGLDIVLRLVLIEKRTAREYTKSIEEPIYDPLLPKAASNVDVERRNSYRTNNAITAGSESLTSPDQTSIWQRRLPPFLWLLSSRRLLVALLASMVMGVLLTSFDAVSLIFRFLSAYIIRSRATLYHLLFTVNIDIPSVFSLLQAMQLF